MSRLFCFVIFFAVLHSSGCAPLPEKEDPVLYTTHDDFVERLTLIERRQTEMMAGNLYHYFDSLTLRQKVTMSFMDSLMTFKQAVYDLQNRIYRLRGHWIQQYEGVNANEADTLRTSLITNLNVHVSIPSDTLSTLNNLLVNLQVLGNGLPYRKGNAQSKVHPSDGYDVERGVVVFWGDEAFTGVSLKEALQSLSLLQTNIARYELEILLRIRAGVESAYWRQN